MAIGSDEASSATRRALVAGGEYPFFSNPCNMGYKRPSTHLVAVMPKFFDNAKSEDGALGCVVKDMQTDQGAVEVLVGHSPASQGHTQQPSRRAAAHDHQPRWELPEHQGNQRHQREAKIVRLMYGGRPYWLIERRQ